MVDGSAGGEYDGGVVGDVHFLLAEFLCRQSFNLYEGTENYVHAKFLRNLIVGRFVGSRAIRAMMVEQLGLAMMPLWV